MIIEIKVLLNMEMEIESNITWSSNIKIQMEIKNGNQIEDGR